MVLNCITIAIFVWNIFILFQAALLAKVCWCEARTEEEDTLQGRKCLFEREVIVSFAVFGAPRGVHRSPVWYKDARMRLGVWRGKQGRDMQERCVRSMHLQTLASNSRTPLPSGLIIGKQVGICKQ